jgi:hypothetical protein
VSVVSAADAAPVDPVHCFEQRARELLDDEDVPAAREVTQEAMRAWPNRPELLWLLADVEFADGDQQTGISCLAKAVDASGGDVEAIGRQIRALSKERLWRETLIAIEGLPAQVRDHPAVRAAVGDFYNARACHAHAVDGYGDRAGLSSSARARRRLSWLRSGGPFRFARHRIDSWEESKLLARLRKRRRTSAQLDAVPNLDSLEAHRLKVRTENAYYEWWYRAELSQAFARWGLKWFPAAVLPVWLVLYLTVKSATFLSGTPSEVWGTLISAAVVLSLAILLVRSQLRDDLTIRGPLRPTPTWFAFLLVLAVLAEIAVAEGYDHYALPTSGWWAWVVFGLVVLPAVCASILVAAAVATVLTTWWIVRVPREHCQVVLLDTLLYILLEMQSPSRKLDLTWRLLWSRQLEWAARRISRDLLSSDSLSYLGSGDWLRQRSAGWAEALRYMQREILTPVPGRQPKLEARLRHEVQCLATGDLGALAWRRPPPSPSQRTTLARKIIEILRTLLVGVLPLGLVLTAHAVLHFNSAVFQWLSILTGAWALLCLVTIIDPAIRDKIDTARSLVATIHEARRI